MTKKMFNSDLETSGQVLANSLTDGTATLSGGVLTASTLTDGTATLSGGVLTADTIVGIEQITVPTVSTTRIESIGDIELVPSQNDGLVSIKRESSDNGAIGLTVKKPSNGSAFVSLVEGGSSPGSQFGGRLVYEGDSSEDMGTDLDTISLQAFAGGSVTNVLSFNNLGSTVRLASNSSIELDSTSVSLTGRLEEPIKVGSSTDTVWYLNGNDALALGSVNRLQTLHPLSPGVTPSSGQNNKYLYLGSDQDSISIQSKELYLFRDAGVNGSGYTLDEVTDTTVHTSSLSGYTRDITWLPPSIAGLPSEFLGRVFVASTTTFTGVHRYLSSSDLSIGDAVELTGDRISKVTSAHSALCAGIVCFKDECPIAGDRTSLGEDLAAVQNPVVYVVASVGDSRHLECLGFNVCNENGVIQPGDLLVTSSTPGYLMKQDDDIVRSKTVGKAMEEVTFDANGQATGIYGFIYCG